MRQVYASAISEFSVLPHADLAASLRRSVEHSFNEIQAKRPARHAPRTVPDMFWFQPSVWSQSASALGEFADKGAPDLEQVYGLGQEASRCPAQIFNPGLDIEELRVFLSDPIIRLNGFRIAAQRF